MSSKIPCDLITIMQYDLVKVAPVFCYLIFKQRGPSVVLLEFVYFTSNEITVDIFEFKISVMDELI